MKIFVINGTGGVGKDTFVRLVEEYVTTYIFSMAEKAKQLAKEIGWDGTKTERNRKMLSDLKLIIDDYNDGNYKYISESIKSLENTNCAVFVMAREKKDIERFVNDFGAIKVLVVRDSIKPITSNIADANVHEINYDCVINNNGTLIDLTYEALDFVKHYNLG